MKKAKNEDSILKPGTVFEKYTIEKFLGKGGMGAVYLARHHVLDSLFAIKTLSPEVASQSRQFVDRFIREAKLACKIKHPNLIAVHDAGKNAESGTYYIVMDYVSGGSLRDLLRQKSHLPPEQAIRIISQMAAALEAACHFGMVHRDIKPENIMFAADGTAKLADLGIAKSTDEQDTVLTIAASVFGTPSYMSPEQAMDSSRVDIRADIYSLGIVFFEMLAGQLPYSGKGTIQILSQVIAEEEIPDVRTFVPDVSPEIAALISAMTEKKLENRLRTPAELRKRLLAISRREFQSLPLPSPDRGRKSSSSSRPDDSSELPDHSRPIGGQPSGKRRKEDILSTTLPTMPTLVKPESRAAQIPPARNPIPGKGSQIPPSPEKTKALSSSSAPVAAPATTPVTTPVRPPFSGGPSPEKNSRDLEHTLLIPSLAQNHSGSSASPLPKKNDGARQNGEAEKTPVRTPAALSSPGEETSGTSTSSIRGNFPENGRGNPPRRTIMLLASTLLLVIVILLFFFNRMMGPSSSAEREPRRKTAAPAVETGMAENDKSHISRPNTAPERELPARQPAEISGRIPRSPERTAASPLMTPDQLGKGQIILLGSSSEFLRSVRNSLIRTFGKQHVAFQTAAGMGEYKHKLREILQASPAFLLLDLSPRYAEDRISNAGFENIIRYHADLLRENEIPFCFILSSNIGNDSRIRFFNETTAELCKLRSIPVIRKETPPDQLLSLVREMKRKVL